MAIKKERKVAAVESVSLRDRFLRLGRAALTRFNRSFREEPKVLRYDSIEDADVLQLENPVVGGTGERWQIKVERYGDEILVEQLYYSQAGEIWQSGLTFFFTTEILGGQEVDELAIKDDPEYNLLDDDKLFDGVCQVFENWPAAKVAVIPIEETFDESELD